MPLVRVDAVAADPQRLAAIGDAVHAALVDAFAIPADDRFQVLRGSAADRIVYDPGFLGVDRDDGAVVVQVFLRRGRTDEQKRAFYRALAKRATSAGVEPRNLIVTLTENGLGDWSFGNGEAQYLDNPPPQPAAMSTLVDYDFGPDARNRLDQARDPGPGGAVAALETFYYALNNADLDVLRAVWSPDPLAQLNNPVGGILRSGDAIAGLYGRIFAGGLSVQVTFTDAATYLGSDTAVFAGRELGSYAGPDGERVPLSIRTSRVFTWHPEQGSWLQTHHHGSIDDPQALAAYQAAALG